ncbi:MAG: hypothetical protein ACKOW9_06225 [Candidatus Paceibacterota bacterium]
MSDLTRVKDEFSEYFSLPLDPFERASEADFYSLEWISLFAESLFFEIVGPDGSYWSAEALAHLSNLIVERLPTIEFMSSKWVKGTLVDQKHSLHQLLNLNFPSLDGSL